MVFYRNRVVTVTRSRKVREVTSSIGSARPIQDEVERRGGSGGDVGQFARGHCDSSSCANSNSAADASGARKSRPPPPPAARGYGGRSLYGGIDEFGAVCQPISSLNPYHQSWRIKVRCTAKDMMREYSNKRGSGKVFSVDLLDSRGDEIKATMFNKAADKWYPVFEKGNVYIISRGLLFSVFQMISCLHILWVSCR